MNTPQLPSDPYAPPAANLDVAPVGTDDAAGPLATRGERFIGAMVDGLVYIAAGIPAFIAMFGLAADGRKLARGDVHLYLELGTAGVVSVLLTLGVVALNAVLVVRRGQSVGKIVAGTRIVLLDGRPPGLWRGVVVRTWLLQILGWLPKVSSIMPVVGLVNILFIFRADRRCLHDLAAGTKVVQVKPAPRA